MNFKMLSGVLVVALATWLSACKDDDAPAPGAPQVSPEGTAVAVIPFESKSIGVTISAAGKLKEVAATTTGGTIAVQDIKGVGTATGTATLVYTAPSAEGTFKINVAVKDERAQESTAEITVTVTKAPPIEIAKGTELSGTWSKGKTYIIKGDVTIPAGKTLTIEEGVTVIVQGDGSSDASPEIAVRGRLYSYGTAENPVKFTVSEDKRLAANIFKGYWGGINGAATCDEMVIEYTHLEYAGAPAPGTAIIVEAGEITAGEPRYALFFGNTAGKFVMKNSRIAYTKDDGMRITGGQIQIVYNTFEWTGETGGESINIKSGTVGDIAFNTVISGATNGVKWSNSGTREPQTDCYVYNNTIVNSGFRRSKSGRGGSLNIEKGGRGKIYNNLIANCRYGARLVKSPDNPDETNTKLGYNFYYGDVQSIVDEFYPSAGSVTAGDYETSKDVKGTVATNAPKFVNFTVTGFSTADAADPTKATFIATYDLHLQDGSPALNAGNTTFTPRLASLTANGKTYTTPAPASYIGAWDKK